MWLRLRDWLWGWFFVCQLLAACSGGDCAIEEAVQTGGLFIVGGGPRPVALMQSLVELSGIAENDTVCVLGWASSMPDTACFYAEASFLLAGHTAVRAIPYPPADDDRRALKGTKLVYITGGDQSKLVRRIDSAAVRELLLDAFLSGTHFAGTSAGAACMSETMITGDQLLQEDYTSRYGRLARKNAVYGKGLGLLQAAGISAIVDQHFIARSRYDRAITALWDYPGMEVWGIDESTAVWVQGKRVEVVGGGQVCRFHAVEAPDEGAGLISGKGMVMDVLVAGASFPEELDRP